MVHASTLDLKHWTRCVCFFHAFARHAHPHLSVSTETSYMQQLEAAVTWAHKWLCSTALM